MQRCTSGNWQYWAFLLGSSENRSKRLIASFKKKDFYRIETTILKARKYLHL